VYLDIFAKNYFEGFAYIYSCRLCRQKCWKSCIQMHKMCAWLLCFL